jgi:hypothetical protein
MTIFDTAAWPTGMELWEHPTNSKTDPFQTTAQQVPTKQLTNNQRAKGGNKLFAQVTSYILQSD